MQPKTVVRTEAVIEILSFGVGVLIAIFASVKETEIWSSECTPLGPDNECPDGATCPIPSARCPSDDPPSWDEGRLEMVWETIRYAPSNCGLHRHFSHHTPRYRFRCLTAKVLYACRLIGLVFVGFAVWSFANFGQMVKQRVGERDWFVRHPNAFQRSAFLNFSFLVAFAVLLFLAAILMLFLPSTAKDFMEWYLDVGFDDSGQAFFQLQSEWIGTHCVLKENVGERSCNDQSLEDWVNWFFLEHFGAAGLYAVGLCSMVTVWAYCVKQLHDHADDPAWQEAISGQRLYAGKVQSVELDSILTSDQDDDNPNLGRSVVGTRRSDAAAGVQ